MDGKMVRRNVRLMEKHPDIDLELAMGNWASFELQSYPYWHERLRQIQNLYDRQSPSNLKQWWFDRRNRPQWATFWVAFVVFVLTVVFGVISSVTGVLQVYASFRSSG